MQICILAKWPLYTILHCTFHISISIFHVTYLPQFKKIIMGLFFKGQKTLGQIHLVQQLYFMDAGTEARRDHKVSRWQNEEGSPCLSWPLHSTWIGESNQSTGYVQQRKKAVLSLLPMFVQNIQEKKTKTKNNQEIQSSISLELTT